MTALEEVREGKIGTAHARFENRRGLALDLHQSEPSCSSLSCLPAKQQTIRGAGRGGSGSVRADRPIIRESGRGYLSAPNPRWR